jgi:hypothetical protein
MEKFKITFEPGMTHSDLDSGSMSEIRWDTMMPFLRLAFNCGDNEKIAGITVTEEGIKAKFIQK